MKPRRVVPRGLKPVRRKLATGEVRTYWYHRRTGTALQHEPGSAEGLLELAALDRKAARLEAAVSAGQGSFAALWLEYRDGPEWRALRPRTRTDYQKVRDWLGPGAEQMIVADLKLAHIMKLRDRGAGERGRRFGNYVLQVVRLVLEWGRLRGWLDGNPAMGAKQIRKPSGEVNRNRAWTQAEVDAFSAAAPFQLAVPFALGLHAGMRQGDALTAAWSAYDRQCIRWTAGKNDHPSRAPVTGTLRKVLERARDQRGRTLQIAVTTRGRAWTASGFRASFFKLIKKLELEGEVGPGLTFHGLRHTVGAAARDLGESDFRVAAAIGDRSTAMAQTYGRDADRAAAQQSVLEAVQKRFQNADLENAGETARSRNRRERPTP